MSDLFVGKLRAVRPLAVLGTIGVLVAACPLAVAVQTARFGLPGVRLGIMPMTIMPAVFRSLPRKLGLELMLTGRLMTASEASAAGFVNATVAAGELEAAAVDLARAAATQASR